MLTFVDPSQTFFNAWKAQSGIAVTDPTTGNIVQANGGTCQSTASVITPPGAIRVARGAGT